MAKSAARRSTASIYLRRLRDSGAIKPVEQSVSASARSISCTCSPQTLNVANPIFIVATSVGRLRDFMFCSISDILRLAFLIMGRMAGLSTYGAGESSIGNAFLKAAWSRYAVRIDAFHHSATSSTLGSCLRTSRVIPQHHAHVIAVAPFTTPAFEIATSIHVGGRELC